MDKKQKEALVLAMLENGESYRNIAQKAKVSPNTIKMLANRAGLDETTSISSRAFELYVLKKTPVEVAIALNLEAEKAINYYHQYFMLLGITEFTRVYLLINDNPWPFVALVKLTQNSRIRDGEVVELLKIANGYLPRVRLECDRLKEEKRLLEAELNSWKAELSNTVRFYQDFCDRNLELKRREDELQISISELEIKKAEMQEAGPNESLSESQDNNTNTNLNPEVKSDDIISTSDELIHLSKIAFNDRQNENDTFHYPPQAQRPFRPFFLDTKDLF